MRRDLPGETDHVLLGGGGLGHPLFLEGALDLEDPVAEPSCFLELFPIGRGLHLSAQAFKELAVPSFQELPHLLDDLMVLVARLVADAGGHAAFELELDAGPFSRAVNLDLASGQREHLANHLERFPQGPGRRVGAVVQGAVFLDSPHDRKTREVLFDGQAEIGVLLVVAQHYVETWAVPFDQITFQDERF